MSKQEYQAAVFKHMKVPVWRVTALLRAMRKPDLMQLAKTHRISVRGSKAAIVDRFPRTHEIRVAVRIN